MYYTVLRYFGHLDMVGHVTASLENPHSNRQLFIVIVIVLYSLPGRTIADNREVYAQPI